ncbi:Putative B3 domain-containing protein At2g27410 [Linum grandiflorum]
MGERVGSEFTLVIHKKLNQTDLSIQNCRFSIRLTEIANEFLTAGEKHQLYEAGNIKIGCFVDPYMEISDKVSLRKWKQGNGCIYTIIGEAWKNVLKKQDLVAGDVVALWSFRTCSGKLCFALLTLERRPTAAEMMIEERPLQIMSPDIDLTLKL